MRTELDEKTKPLLLCDIDGVVYPYIPVVQRVVEEMLGRTLPAARWYNLQRSWGIDSSTHEAAHLRLFANHESHQVDPVDGAAEALWKLHSLGVRLRFITRRVSYTASIGGSFEHAADITNRWLQSWAPPHDVFFEMNKADFDGPSTLMLEDNPPEAEAMIAKGRKVWLLDQPYNQESDIRRCRWGDQEIADALLISDSLAGATA